MALEQLRARLERQRALLDNQAFLQDIVDQAKVVLQQGVPVDTGTMARDLLTQSAMVSGTLGLHTGLGDREILGHENDAPSQTIAEFLDDYPEFRTHGYQRDHPGDRRFAWWDLPQEAKDILQANREGGEYGGGQGGVGEGKASYFFQQEGGLDDWTGSAAKAAIVPTHFVETAMEQIHSTVVPAVMSDLRARMK